MRQVYGDKGGSMHLGWRGAKKHLARRRCRIIPPPPTQLAVIGGRATSPLLSVSHRFVEMHFKV